MILITNVDIIAVPLTSLFCPIEEDNILNIDFTLLGKE